MFCKTIVYLYFNTYRLYINGLLYTISLKNKYKNIIQLEY